MTRGAQKRTRTHAQRAAMLGHAQPATTATGSALVAVTSSGYGLVNPDVVQCMLTLDGPESNRVQLSIVASEAVDQYGESAFKAAVRTRSAPKLC